MLLQPHVTVWARCNGEVNRALPVVVAKQIQYSELILQDVALWISLFIRQSPVDVIQPRLHLFIIENTMPRYIRAIGHDTETV